MNTSVTDYQTKLDKLFEVWEKESKMKGYHGFCRDGLMNKGVINSGTISNGEPYWVRERGNENYLWEKAPMRVMFLNKDQNNNPNEDSRYWILRKHATDITLRFYKNIALWFYGLLHMNKDGEYPNFEEICFPSIYSPFIDGNPVAIVNCKKESGEARVHNEVLKQHILLFESYLIEEIHILNPDIIVCGGGSSLIKNFIGENVYDIERVGENNNWVFYNAKYNKVIIDSYHPSYYGSSQKEMYEDMMNAFKEFILLNPNFLDANRQRVSV